MSAGTQISQLQAAQNIPNDSKFITEMGDGSGTKAVTKEVLTQTVGEGLKIGDLENLQTTDKTSIIAAINEAAQSGGGGSSVDILDTKEEIEANTEDGKAAGAQAVQEMFSEINSNLGGYSFGETEDGQPGFRKPGADTVIPFSGGGDTAYRIFDGTITINNSYRANINVTKYDDYKNLTVDNFYMTKAGSTVVSNTWTGAYPNIHSYDPSTGTLTLSSGWANQKAQITLWIIPNIKNKEILA